MRRIAVFLLLALAFMAAPAFADDVVVADFDSGTKPNNIGGDLGTWDKDPNDTTMFSKMSFVEDDAIGIGGYALRLDYDVDSPNPAYNGFWMKLEGLDASVYDTLDFYVKGDAAKGYTTQIKIELKNSAKEVGKYLLTGITDSWQRVSIPLDKFSGLSDRTNISEFVIVFDDVNATKKAGTIYVDQIAFSN